jgi:hypothetical protein
MHLDKRWVLEIKTVKPQVLYVATMIALISLGLLLALFIANLANDWSSPSDDEPSIPAVRTY